MVCKTVHSWFVLQTNSLRDRQDGVYLCLRLTHDDPIDYLSAAARKRVNLVVSALAVVEGVGVVTRPSVVRGAAWR